MSDRLTDQRGFALVEALMASLVLIIGVLGMTVAMASSRHLQTTAQRGQSGQALAEQELEKLHASTYASLGLSSLPTGSATTGNTVAGDTNPVKPNYWVSGSNLKIVTSWNNSASAAVTGTAAAGEALVTGGTIAPGPTAVTNGSASGKVYRYVTQVKDCDEIGTLTTGCTDPDAKRITVAVVMDDIKGVGVEKPIWMSTIVADPAATS